MRIWLLLALCLTVGIKPLAFADAATVRDQWEGTDIQSRALHECSAVDRSLIAPVPSARRAEAIVELEKSSVIPLTENEAAGILELKNDPVLASAPGRVKKEIEKLQEQKHLELDEKIGSWSNADQERLNALQALDAAQTPLHLKPYLARAIGKAPNTGGFYVAVCGETLSVLHGSLGRGPVPPTLRLPIVVFLSSAPRFVVATWAQAE